MKRIYLLLLLLVSGLAGSFAQTYHWIQTIRPGGNEHPWDITVDNYNHLYATGRVKFMSIFGDGSNIDTTLGIGAETDVFLAKYTLDGQLLWVRRDGSTLGDWGRAVSTDLQGNIVVTGDFSDTASFAPFTIYGLGNNVRNIFIAKYDSSGNCLWAKAAGYTTPHSRGYGITCDSLGNIYVTGHISGPSNFDGKPFGTLNKNLPFIAKFSPAGNCIWVKTLAAQYSGEGYDIKFGKSGDLYLTGRYVGTMTINSVTYPGTPTWGEVFVARMDTAGNFQWVKIATGTYQTASYGLAVDTSENVYITGTFADNINFGTTTLNAVYYSATAATANAAADIFLAKYTSAGTFQWARAIGGKSYDEPEGLVCTKSGKVIVGTSVEDTVMFDSNVIVTSADTVNSLILSYDGSGNLLWYDLKGGTTNTQCHSVTVDSDDNIYMAGAWEGTAYFDSFTLVAGNGFDGIIARIVPPLDPVLQLSSSAVCQTDTVNFMVLQDGSPLTYNWSFSGGDISASSSSSPTVIYNGAGGASYQLIISSLYETDTINGVFNVNTLPVVSLGNDTTLCVGNPFSLSPGSGFAGYAWSDGSSGTSFSPTASGTYWVTVTDTNLCSASDTAMVTFDTCTTVEEQEPGAVVSISPNPNNGSFVVSLEDFKGKTFSLFNATGQQVINPISLDNTINTLRIDMPAGIYYYLISSSSGIASGKLIVE